MSASEAAAPSVADEAGGGEASTQDAPPLKPYRVLLVDDDPATLMAMKQHLVRMRGRVKYEGAYDRRVKELPSLTLSASNNSGERRVCAGSVERGPVFV